MLRYLRNGLMLASAMAICGFCQGPSVPRTSPEFVIHFPGGQDQLLSSYKGKVVALEFLWTTCPHCQHSSQVFSQLFQQYGSEGFQPIGVAFNDQGPTPLRMLVPEFVRNFQVNYPVGFASRDDVLNYLTFSTVDRRLVVPQVVWIDRRGVIRSQTPVQGDANMLSEEFWKQQIETLVKEPAAATRHTRRPSRHSSSPASASRASLR
ncbi:MAG TPA: TlpA disulfide reductase family protein [Bryobacteraceae bacterium]|nr:TlpA disulfide reductase family protein [Bryobacteraceae bacterium]